jgi:hypothetical protein
VLFLKRFFVIYLVLILSMPVQLLAYDESDIDMGKMKGKKDAMGDVNKICWLGAGVTIIGFGVAMIWQSSEPDPAGFVGKSPEYVRAYTESYNSRVKKEQIIYSALGCAGTVLTVTMLVLISDVLGDLEANCINLDACFENTEETESCIESPNCFDNTDCGSGGSSCAESN